MVRFIQHTHTHTHSGFSLIELMVVISITTLLISLSIVPFAVIKIKTAHTEGYQNIKLMHSLALSYLIDNEDVTFAFNVGPWAGFFPGDTCAPELNSLKNPLGFTMSREVCLKLRNQYYFWPNSLDPDDPTPNDPKKFTASALNEHFNTTIEFWVARGTLPTRLCKSTPSDLFTFYYLDQLEMYESGIIKHIENMLKTCF